MINNIMLQDNCKNTVPVLKVCKTPACVKMLHKLCLINWKKPAKEKMLLIKDNASILRTLKEHNG